MPALFVFQLVLVLPKEGAHHTPYARTLVGALLQMHAHASTQLVLVSQTCQGCFTVHLLVHGVISAQANSSARLFFSENPCVPQVFFLSCLCWLSKQTHHHAAHVGFEKHSDDETMIDRSSEWATNLFQCP